MIANVLVTGGTGTLGRAVVARLEARSHCIRVLSRHATVGFGDRVEVITGDLVSGSGLREAVANVAAIIHCASAPQDAQQVDVTGTRALLQAAQAHGTPHIIYPSIVGVDRSTYPYYQAKYATEAVIAQGPLPWSIVRTTQFHDFVLRLIHSFDADTAPVVSVPEGMRFQSIDVGEVAERLVTLVEAGSAAHAPDMGGPQVRTIQEMTAAYLRIRGKTATIRSIPTDTYAVFKSGINLVPDHALGTIAWETFLHRRYDSTHPISSLGQHTDSVGS